MFNIFKRKKQLIEQREPTKEEILTAYIVEARSLGYTDEQIRKKFIEKNYPHDFIEYLFQLNERRFKMPKKEVEEQDYDDEMDEEVEESEEEEEPKQKPKRVMPKQEIKKEQEPTMDEKLQAAIMNHEQRIQNLESAMFRIKSI